MSNMTQVELCCVVLGSGAIFPIKIALTAKGHDIRQAIADTEDINVLPTQLTLFLAKEKDKSWLKNGRDLDDVVLRAVDNKYVKLWPMWRLDDAKCFGPVFEPEDEHVHVLVEITMTQAAPARPVHVGTPSRAVESDISPEKLWLYSGLQSSTYPAPSELLSILRRPLPFRMALSEKDLTKQISERNGPVVNCEKVCSCLLWIRDGLSCTSIATQLHWSNGLFRRLLGLFQTVGSAKQLEMKIYSPDATNHENNRTNARMERYGIFASVDRLLMVRGEVATARITLEESCSNLTSSMRDWNTMFYGNLPYIVGFATSGPALRIVAIDRNLVVTTIVDFQSIFVDKAEVVKAFYNLTFVLCQLRLLSRPVQPSPLLPFWPYLTSFRKLVMRDDRVEHIFSSRYPSQITKAYVERRIGIYKALETLTHWGSRATHLQTVMRLDFRVVPKPLTDESWVVVELAPLGIQRQPADIDEVREWLRAMLTALQFWHGKNYCHGDICWRNILYTSEETSPGYWFLIDMDKSQRPGKERIDWGHPYQQEKLRRQHDLYQLGLLLNGLRRKLTLPDDLLQVLDELLSSIDSRKVTSKSVLVMMDPVVGRVDGLWEGGPENGGGLCRLYSIASSMWKR